MRTARDSLRPDSEPVNPDIQSWIAVVAVIVLPVILLVAERHGQSDSWGRFAIRQGPVADRDGETLSRGLPNCCDY